MRTVYKVWRRNWCSSAEGQHTDWCYWSFGFNCYSVTRHSDGFISHSSLLRAILGSQEKRSVFERPATAANYKPNQSIIWFLVGSKTGGISSPAAAPAAVQPPDAVCQSALRFITGGLKQHYYVRNSSRSKQHGLSKRDFLAYRIKLLSHKTIQWGSPCQYWGSSALTCVVVSPCMSVQ